MNFLQKLGLFGLVFVALFGGSLATKAATGPSIDIEPILDQYEACVADSDHDLAYRCSSTGLVFTWPADSGLDPRVNPIYTKGGVFVCASSSTLVLATTERGAGDSLYLEILSPSACTGEVAYKPSRALNVNINPHRDPKLGPTMIMVDHGNGIKSFHMGVCLVGGENVAFFLRSTDNTDITVATYHAPRWCGRTN